MFHIILFEPEIPPNTGNIIRLCANTGVRLHLIHPLGFDLESKKLRRAGLDYREFADVLEYQSLAECLEKLSDSRVFALSTKGRTNYAQTRFQANDAFIFGPETRGLPDKFLNTLKEESRLRVPMLPDSRSLNLSNTVALVVYEAWRQNDFVVN
ncbi:MAG: tRNA (uridine(34)/cytosine(34)/5-carboxymethylaminomethyluridine(34)-2'-O)-methyltransferase TrmL [Gammaproteobacteria bacterium]|nr:tRNA (uridine(34)/cytosine(34)/5-carboxymethylaminomethyluridine(34)-2'-O)-methyltransferase TrmL [Gammaproteobacteria bacterium]NNC96803.1 tRNA (uridine(34)/cytosine(34)/5-carboxymethylaminomethyluridine(34)-2'-O)-methyltransferase TrmL [Gammaproteobacteria bacterium]NNM14157.1 tRNA (uridine(34)/cytosine(34)/5-carboxymethylaminomethyluridine(34)-2'-O)-methyltransferase TrmL [Gammaproteobacteria bacterium]